MYSQPSLDYKSWVRQQSSNPNPKLRLFCFSHAGGGASTYRLWHKYLPTAIDVCPVQLPGRESRVRESPYTEMEKLIRDLSKVLKPALDIPYVLFGHSLGAIIAFEFARFLKRNDEKIPEHLIFAACPAPHSPDQPPPINHLPRSEFIDSLKKMEGTPEELFKNPDLLDFFLPLLRSDFKLFESYVNYRDQPLDSPISVYGGIGDRNVTEDSLDYWEHQTNGKFVKRMFPGNHYFLRDNPNFLFQALMDDLSRLC